MMSELVRTMTMTPEQVDRCRQIVRLPVEEALDRPYLGLDDEPLVTGSYITATADTTEWVWDDFKSEEWRAVVVDPGTMTGFRMGASGFGRGDLVPSRYHIKVQRGVGPVPAGTTNCWPVQHFRDRDDSDKLMQCLCDNQQVTFTYSRAHVGGLHVLGMLGVDYTTTDDADDMRWFTVTYSVDCVDSGAGRPLHAACEDLVLSEEEVEAARVALANNPTLCDLGLVVHAFLHPSANFQLIQRVLVALIQVATNEERCVFTKADARRVYPRAEPAQATQ